MSRIARLMLLVAASVPCTAHAGWKATTPQAVEAVKQPRIAAVMAATARMDAAILARDITAFSAVFAEDAAVNNPYNRVARKRDAEHNLKTGLIDYTSLERFIEYAATRGEHDVVLMGEEALTPVNKARFSGKQVRRRTTEIWTNVSGQWKLSVRQATVYQAED